MKEIKLKDILRYQDDRNDKAIKITSFVMVGVLLGFLICIAWPKTIKIPQPTKAPEQVTNNYVSADPCTLDVVACDEEPETNEPLKGKASWYDYTLASGWSSRGHFVCATRDFPRYSYVEVSYKDKSVVCRVTDFGPDEAIHPDRIIDLSSTAFSELAPLSRGIIEVEVEQYYETNINTN